MLAKRVITPSGMGFLLLDFHSAGCERIVFGLAAAVPRDSRPSFAPQVRDLARRIDLVW